jgi:chromosome segregation ATPase
MILLRQKLYSKTSKKKEEKSKALRTSLGVAGVGTGGAFLGKYLLDEKAGNSFTKGGEKALEEVDKAKKHLKGLDKNISEKARILEAAKTSNERYLRQNAKVGEKELEAAIRASNQKLDSGQLRKEIKHLESLRDSAQASLDTANRNYEKKLTELDKSLKTSLKKNKKLRNAALIGTGLAAAGTYGILKHRENKRKKS